MSLKTGDMWDSKSLRTRNGTPSDETMCTSGYSGLDMGVGAKREIYM